MKRRVDWLSEAVKVLDLIQIGIDAHPAAQLTDEHKQALKIGRVQLSEARKLLREAQGPAAVRELDPGVLTVLDLQPRGRAAIGAIGAACVHVSAWRIR